MKVKIFQIISYYWNKAKLILDYLLKICLYLLPIKNNKIVFHEARGYGDNPKYIANEILKQNLKYELIWILDDVKAIMPETIKKVKSNSFRALYNLATAHIFIDDGKNGLLNLKKKKQFYLQTWHGDFPLKYIEKEAINNLSEWYINNSIADSKSTNAIISGSTFFSDICKNNFWLPSDCKIIEVGLPRNDIFYEGDEFRKKLKEKYGFAPSSKILLYAPTFRDDDSNEGFLNEFDSLHNYLESITNNQWYIIIRMHENASNNANNYVYNDYTINGTIFSDVQELVVMSDILITDYSSIIIDFFINKKPVFLYVKDLEKYVQNSRGLRNIFFSLPVSYNKTLNDLKDSINSFNYEKYIQSVNTFLEQHFKPFGNGNASVEIVKILKNVIDSK